MNYLGPIGRAIKGLYSGINGATLTGAIDVIVVEDEFGNFKCTPFHVRFGKLGVLRSREKVVDLEVNGFAAPIRMKLGDSGEAFFVQELDSDDELDDQNLATSPLPSSPQHSDSDHQRNLRAGEQASKVDANFDGNNVKIGGDDGLNLVGVDAPSVTKMDDVKGRKRRRKRRKNQGSKSDISINMNAVTEPEPEPEAMFKMDEDLNGVAEALKGLDLSGVGSMSQSRSYHRDFYSDTEVDATFTPQNTRPSTPIQSDSEYEINKMPKDGEIEVGKWPWGELPSTVTTTPVTTPIGNLPTQSGISEPSQPNSPAKSTSSEDNPLSSDDESRNRLGSENRSMLASMFSFMKRNNSQGSGPVPINPSTGIYLDDLNIETMDPEVAALYFPNFGRDRETKVSKKDEDVESGQGSSLPQSPQPGSSPKISRISDFMEEHQRLRSGEDSSPCSNFEAVSLCGSSLALFEQSQLTYDELVENPDVILNAAPESIVVKIDGKLVPWPAALPQLLSTTFFKRPLPPTVYEKLMNQYVKDSNTRKDDPSPISAAASSGATATFGPEAKDSTSSGIKRQSSWFPWRRSHNSSTGVLPATDENRQLSQDQSLHLSDVDSVSKSRTTGTPSKEKSNTAVNLKNGSGTSSSDESEGGGGLEDKESKSGRSSRKEMHAVINIPSSIPPTGICDKFKKSLRLSSDQIADLGLKYGRNEAIFSVTTAYQGTTVARCHIYLWRFDDRVVVSDIDGTITKSDVLGHILPIIGNDWAQSGVAQLFTQIQDNGYKMLYLSARAIGQAAITREYLRSIRQGDVTLPDGPLLLNPTSLMSALHREVIEKKPEEFKIACLKDVSLLFPDKPFYAGYGNKINDVWAYRAVGIPIPRIFTINHKGELRHALTNTFQSSYTSLGELADHIFPVYKFTSVLAFSQTDGFNTFEFWREQLPIVTDVDGDIVLSKVPSPS